MVEYLPSKQAAAGSSPVFRSICTLKVRYLTLTRISMQINLQELRFTCSICFRKSPAPNILQNQRFFECRASPVFRSINMAAWPSGKAGACKAFIPSSNLGAA